MPKEIKNIKAYSESDGRDKVAANNGEYDSTGHSVTIFKPYELLHGGPKVNEPFTLAYDENRQPVKLKNMKYNGKIPRTESLFFIPRTAP